MSNVVELFDKKDNVRILSCPSCEKNLFYAARDEEWEEFLVCMVCENRVYKENMPKKKRTEQEDTIDSLTTTALETLNKLTLLILMEKRDE